jgi:hypothetical protein
MIISFHLSIDHRFITFNLQNSFFLSTYQVLQSNGVWHFKLPLNCSIVIVLVWILTFQLTITIVTYIIIENITSLYCELFKKISIILNGPKLDKLSSPKLWFKNLKHLTISISNSKNWKHVWEFMGFLFYTFIHCPFTKWQCLSSQNALNFFWLVSLVMLELMSWKLRWWLVLASSLFFKELVILGLFFCFNLVPLGKVIYYF